MSELYAVYRVRQTKTNIIIVHRRKGRARIRSHYDRQFGWPGHWALFCGQWAPWGANVTTKPEEVTCMKCLRRME